MMRSTAHWITRLALLLPASLAAAVPAAAAATEPPGYSFKGSGVLVSAAPGCDDRRKLTPGERFEFTLIRTDKGGDLIFFFWRPGFRWFWTPGQGPFRQRGPYLSLTSYDDHIALIYEGRYENFVRKPAKIGPETTRIEISFTVRNQDKSETCTATWRASGKRFTPPQAEVDALTRRLSSGRK